MASYSYSSSYSVGYNTSTGQITIGSGFLTIPTTRVLADGQPDNVFSPGDELTVDGATSLNVINTFVGYTDDGILVAATLVSDAAVVSYTFVTTNSSLVLGEIIPVTVDNFVVCFLAGTRIATPDGERAVEELAIGDMVLTAGGETRPVRWIGRQKIASLFADALRCYPIHIIVGALGDQMPQRDLYLSPDHALLVDGVLAQAGALVNGSTIARVERPEAHFTYFHIELEDHALILAEGVPAETFVDNVTRRRFDNYAEFEALYGSDGVAMPEMDLPRVKSARQLPSRIRNRLAGRAAEMDQTQAA